MIYETFNNRCIVCWKPATEINEIVLRSRTKGAFRFENCVPLCSFHHWEYHHNGVTPEKIKAMQERRKEFLYLIGKDENV